ncbi:37S ribosomal protein NAM9 [Yarrowia sp. B02]|nr:37S ribosomal protein NAM9 [Yarrowia sp. B02]
MPHRQKNLFSLARGKVRASWNPRNLYNLYKKADPLRTERTLFQKKWASKRELRAYHGEHIREGTMERQIPKSLQGVVLPLGDDVVSNAILANNRFTQEIQETDDEGNIKLKTPFAVQTFVHLEKRLDFAVFRSMFAASVRQAGQFIRQGNVTVNGVKIKHASYPLKPGDLIHVNPEKVLFAAGKPKPSVEEAVKIDNRQIKKFNQYIKKCNDDPEKMWAVRQDKITKRAVGSLLDPKKQVKLQKKNEEAFQKMIRKSGALTSAGILEDLINGREEFLKTQSEDSQVIGSMLLKLVDQHFPADASEAVSPSSEGFVTPEAVMEFLDQRSKQRINELQSGAAPSGVDAQLVEEVDAEQVKTSADYTSKHVASTTEKRVDYVNKIMEQRHAVWDAIAEPKQQDFKNHPKDANHLVTVQNPHAKKAIAQLLTYRKSEFDGVPERKVAYVGKQLVQLMHANVIQAFHDEYVEHQRGLLNPEAQDSEVNPHWLQRLGPLQEKIDAAAAAENEAEAGPDFPWQKKHLYGRKDTSKPYFTPWRFRPFISPSIIYPHHIEVDFKTCSSVYLRDPVARPGMSEVISPFSLLTHEFANLYYIKK